jgi:glycolate oxidase iron-sulfur subunit
MQTSLSADFRGTPDGAEAEAILRKCVHCGFCLATCPTYQLLGDELDSPRGRIYLMKQVLEGHAPTRATQLHLDRCLTCRNCESTCPSGVEYGRLIDIGRRTVAPRVPRAKPERALRWLLREGLTSRWFPAAVNLGRLLRPLLPAALQAKVPPRPRAAQPAPDAPAVALERKVLMMAGCVQPTLLPEIDRATVRVLRAAGIEVVVAPSSGCCGAIREHLSDHEGALDDMRRNIDAWWPHLEGSPGSTPAMAIVMNASGCGVLVKEYAHHLAHDPAYAEKARRVSACTRDIAELIADRVPELQARVQAALARRASADDPAGALLPLAVHLPCTLQHGQKLPGILAQVLTGLGFRIAVPEENHLCCGSAGTYSVLEPGLARQLRDRKLDHLRALKGAPIVSANVGCIQHLQTGTNIPVRHWIEVLDEVLS